MKSIQILNMNKLGVVSLFVLAFLNGHAQFVPVPQTFNTPMGPIHTTHYMYMPHNYGSGSYSPKFKFTVILNNDSTFTFKSQMMAEKKKMYVEYKDKKTKKKVKLFPSDTKSLSGFNALSISMTGMPVDSCWLFVLCLSLK